MFCNCNKAQLTQQRIPSTIDAIIAAPEIIMYCLVASWAFLLGQELPVLSLNGNGPILLLSLNYPLCLIPINMHHPHFVFDMLYFKLGSQFLSCFCF